MNDETIYTKLFKLILLDITKHRMMKMLSNTGSEITCFGQECYQPLESHLLKG